MFPVVKSVRLLLILILFLFFFFSVFSLSFVMILENCIEIKKEKKEEPNSTLISRVRLSSESGMES